MGKPIKQKEEFRHEIGDLILWSPVMGKTPEEKRYLKAKQAFMRDYRQKHGRCISCGQTRDWIDNTIVGIACPFGFWPSQCMGAEIRGAKPAKEIYSPFRSTDGAQR